VQIGVLRGVGGTGSIGPALIEAHNKLNAIINETIVEIIFFFMHHNSFFNAAAFFDKFQEF